MCGKLNNWKIKFVSPEKPQAMVENLMPHTLILIHMLSLVHTVQNLFFYTLKIHQLFQIVGLYHVGAQIFMCHGQVLLSSLKWNQYGIGCFHLKWFAINEPSWKQKSVSQSLKEETFHDSEVVIKLQEVEILKTFYGICSELDLKTVIIVA